MTSRRNRSARRVQWLWKSSAAWAIVTLCSGRCASSGARRMSRRGFALLAVLWTLTAITMLTGAAMAVARLGSTTTRNRVLLARAAWAREACGEILQARYAQD